MSPGPRVLVTRPAAQAGAWVERLRERGIDAQALPLIDIDAAADPHSLQQLWAGLHGYALVMFVSPNAVQHFFAARDGAPWPTATRAASPGPGTSEALRAAGVAQQQIVEPAADASQFDSQALWAVLSRQEWHGTRALIVRGGEGAEGEGRNWLADTLREHGAQVDFAAAYRRAAPQWDAARDTQLRQTAAQAPTHLWLFSSSQAITHLTQRLQQLGLGTPGASWSAVATHPRIAEAARQAGFAQVFTSAPGVDAVVAAVSAAAHTPSIQSPAVSGAAMLDSAVNDTTPPAPAVEAPPPSTEVLRQRQPAWLWPLMLVAVGVAGASAWMAWSAQQRVQLLEQELVRRQQDSQGQATEARLAAKQAQDLARETAAKAALIEARVAEVAIQRSQLEELITSLSRSRDENLLVDIEAGLRVALQQTGITGSAEPLVAALRSADERLARVNQPRLEGVRRAIARDLDRVKAVGVADISTLVIKLDEAVRLVDELPLLSDATEVKAAAPAKPARALARSASGTAAAASAPAPWQVKLEQWWEQLWGEVRSLLRVTRIHAPEAMLITPEQSFFLRENLKLRLLNARLALLSRQFETAQSDLQAAIAALNRYFDASSRRTLTATELLRQVAAQSRQAGVPRPDNTLAALAAATAGR